VKLGLLGGTFDPIHNAHLFIAEATRVALGLDRILFLPTGGAHYRSPPVASLEHRLAMLRLAIASNPHFALDLSDVDELASGYTADLLPRLRARFPNDRLVFIVGSDSLIETPWRRFDEVLAQLDAFAVAPRAARPRERIDAFLASLPPEQSAKITVLDLPQLAESATYVRDQVSRGGAIRYLVPEPVARYIAESEAYAPAPVGP
jgi:nicotinate-nucleotide adenylyltransferase